MVVGHSDLFLELEFTLVSGSVVELTSDQFGIRLLRRFGTDLRTGCLGYSIIHTQQNSSIQTPLYNMLLSFGTSWYREVFLQTHYAKQLFELRYSSSTLRTKSYTLLVQCSCTKSEQLKRCFESTSSFISLQRRFSFSRCTGEENVRYHLSPDTNHIQGNLGEDGLPRLL